MSSEIPPGKPRVSRREALRLGAKGLFVAGASLLGLSGSSRRVPFVPFHPEAFRPAGSFEHAGVLVTHGSLTASHERLAREMAQEIRALHPFQDSSRPVDRLDLHDKNSPELPDGYSFETRDERDAAEMHGVVSGHLDGLGDGLHVPFVCHEGAHGVYWAKEGTRERREYDSFWEKNLKTLALGSVAESLNRPDLWWKEESPAENLPFVKLFDESNYLKGREGVKPGVGHPYENATELFASATTVMRHFQSEFKQNLGVLKRENPAQYRLALQTALGVVKLHGSNHENLFHTGLLSHLRAEWAANEIK
jgi:hypothetical protein